MSSVANPEDFPAGLSADLREAWSQLGDRYQRLGIEMMEQYSIDVAAQPRLLSYLRNTEAADQAAEKIREEGSVLRDRFGQHKKNPWEDVYRDRSSSAQRDFRLLGFDQEQRGADQGKLAL